MLPAGRYARALPRATLEKMLAHAILREEFAVIAGLPAFPRREDLWGDLFARAARLHQDVRGEGRVLRPGGPGRGLYVAGLLQDHARHDLRGLTQPRRSGDRDGLQKVGTIDEAAAHVRRGAFVRLVPDAAPQDLAMASRQPCPLVLTLPELRPSCRFRIG